MTKTATSPKIPLIMQNSCFSFPSPHILLLLLTLSYFSLVSFNFFTCHCFILFTFFLPLLKMKHYYTIANESFDGISVFHFCVFFVNVKMNKLFRPAGQLFLFCSSFLWNLICLVKFLVVFFREVVGFFLFHSLFKRKNCLILFY